MAEPEITVTITDTEFSVGELREFLDTVTSIDGMSSNALIAVKLDNVTSTTSNGPIQFTLAASTAYREGGN
jgi:hypothetical protein